MEKLVGLIICRSQNDATDLARVLQPEIPFESVDHTNSLLKAVHAQEELKAHVCFISDEFPVDEIEVYARDARRLHEGHTVVVVLVQPEISPGFDRKSLIAHGIDLVISRVGTEKDKSELLETLAEFSVHAEVKRRVVNIKKVLDMLLNEVNKAAESKRRGSLKEAIINRVPAEFVASQASWNQDVRHQYYDMLINRTMDTEAPIADQLMIPKEILDRQLPHLESDTYRGISHRVWTKLQKKHGIKKSAKLGGPDADSSEEE